MKHIMLILLSIFIATTVLSAPYSMTVADLWSLDKKNTSFRIRFYEGIIKGIELAQIGKKDKSFCFPETSSPLTDLYQLIANLHISFLNSNYLFGHLSKSVPNTVIPARKIIDYSNYDDTLLRTFKDIKSPNTPATYVIYGILKRDHSCPTI